VRIAVDAVRAASQPHHFLAVTKQGRSAIAATAGNPDCHVILRGGHVPNYDAPSVEAVCRETLAAGLTTRLMIDASHGNSGKRPERQPLVIEDIAVQIESGERRIGGVMIESNLVAGRQDLVSGKPLVYGQSVTDGCLDWTSSVKVLERLAAAVARQRERVGRRRGASVLGGC
jgi:3-deoxy-7-phosphoheptulonate synthase